MDNACYSVQKTCRDNARLITDDLLLGEVNHVHCGCDQFSDDSPGRNGDDSAMEENNLLTDEQQSGAPGRLHGHRMPRFIIPHYSPFKAVWDWITLLLVLYTAVVTPFMAAFMLSDKNRDADDDVSYENMTSSPAPSSSLSSSSSPLNSSSDSKSSAPSVNLLSSIDMFVDIMFIADILINFRTTYLHNGEVVSDPRKIAVNYIKSWFLIDAAAAIPFDLLLYGTGTSDVSRPFLI